MSGGTPKFMFAALGQTLGSIGVHHRSRRRFSDGTSAVQDVVGTPGRPWHSWTGSTHTSWDLDKKIRTKSQGPAMDQSLAPRRSEPQADPGTPGQVTQTRAGTLQIFQGAQVPGGPPPSPWTGAFLLGRRNPWQTLGFLDRFHRHELGLCKFFRGPKSQAPLPPHQGVVSPGRPGQSQTGFCEKRENTFPIFFGKSGKKFVKL